MAGPLLTIAALTLPTGPAIAGGAVLGAILGSFLATVAVRWPAGRSVLSGRSTCDNCAAGLRWWELVPLVSWLMQRGQCRHCGGAIAATHPLMECLAALIGAAALAASPGIGGLALALCGWQLLLLGWLDARHYWLPHLLSALLAISGLALGGIAMASLALDVPLSDRLIGLVAGYAPLALIAVAYRRLRGRDGLGGGDAPMLGAIGAWTGWSVLPLVLLLASFAGLASALVRLFRARARQSDLAVMTMRLPLGTLLALATPAALAMLVMGS